MADSNQAIEWYLARDGQQHGPVTDTELQKIIEFGYLKPTDLVWRQGMEEWALAESVLDLRPAKDKAPPAPERPQPTAPHRPEAYQRAQDGPQPGQPVAPHPTGSATGPTQGYAPNQTPNRSPSAERAGSERNGMGAPAPGGPARPGSYQQMPAPGPYAAQPAAASQDHAAYQSALQGTGGSYGGPKKGAPAAQGRPGLTPQDRELQSHGPDFGRAAGSAQPADYDDREPQPARGFPWRAIAILVVLAGLGGGGFALYRTGALSALPFLAAPTENGAIPVISRPSTPSRDAAESASVAVLPAEKSSASMDEFLQKSALWQRLKQDFPDWYRELNADLSRQSADGRTERELQATIIRSQVELRRKHSGDALAAGSANLKAIAASFVENLSRLSRESTAACYGYISQGEASPAIAELKSAQQRVGLEAQLSAIFAAVAEGRKSPVRYDAPKREDYDALSNQLSKRGWTAADLQVFTDARALSRAAPEKVCQMVQDWFAAQLAIEDEAAQLRLLGEALKPVVAG